MQVVKMPVKDIAPYENNPRKNDMAVDAVVESFKQCGYIAPIIIDENNIILAGHTRLKAAKKLGWKDVEVIVREGLTEEQKKKYRILDNKTSEFSGWDFTKLEQELAGLDFGDFDFELNEKTTPLNIDELYADIKEEKAREPKRIKCPLCGGVFEQ